MNLSVPSSPWYHRLPMWLTWARVWMIPVFVTLYVWPFEGHLGWATLVFGLAAITDFWDGYLARRWHVQTRMGAFLDPVADKLMVVAALVLISSHYQDWVITLVSVVILLREVFVSALRDIMSQMGQTETVKVSWMGKAKTTAQLFGITALIYGDWLWGVPWFEIGYVLLLLSAWFSVVSLWQYTLSAWPYLKS